jgi:type II secretory pathway pseudopilin PulG
MKTQAPILSPTPRLHPVKTSTQAFSLTEILIALGIIAFSLVTIFGLFAGPIKISITNQNETAATLIANHIFSQIRAYGIGGSSPINTGTTYFDENMDITTNPNDAIYQVTVDATTSNNSIPPHQKITITISLASAGKSPAIATFSTIIPSPTAPAAPKP